MPPADDGDEWDDPPGVDEQDIDDPELVWPTNGFATAAWAGWLALAYALLTGMQAVFAPGGTPLRALLVAAVGVGLLVGVHLAGGDPRLWRRG